jgi:hypothetical protein
MSPSPSPTASPSPTPAPASPSPATSPSASPTAAPKAIEAAFRPVPAQKSVDRTSMSHVAWTGTRFVAVGSGPGNRGAVMDSMDGKRWRLQSGLRPKAPLNRVAAGPLGVVALGTVGERPAAWVSRDGVAWDTKAHLLPGKVRSDRTLQVTDVAAGPDGWLAVGREDPRCMTDCGTLPVRAWIWTSADGRTWRRVADQRSLAGGGMNAVTWTGERYVAGGDANGTAAIWTSSDGRTWTRVPAKQLAIGGKTRRTDTTVMDVAAGPDGVAAAGVLGQQDRSRTYGWWSKDGVAWMAAKVARPEPGQAFGASVSASGYLMAGPSGRPGCRGGIWDSVTGRSWRCVATAAPFEGLAPHAVASSADTQVVVGDRCPEGRECTGSIWWRPSR